MLGPMPALVQPRRIALALPLELWVASVGTTEAGPEGWSSLRRRQRAGGTALALRAARALIDLPEAELRLERTPGGRPHLRLAGAEVPGLYVSIAHSGQLVMAAAARCPVGVDLEPPLEAPHLDAWALGPELRAALQALPPAQRPIRRAEGWCEMEAVGKARGVGLSVPFAQLQPRPDAQVIRGEWEGFRWVLVTEPAEETMP